MVLYEGVGVQVCVIVGVGVGVSDDVRVCGYGCGFGCASVL